MLLPILLAVAVLTFWMMPATARPHLVMALNVAFVVAVMPATESVVLLAAFLAVCFALLHQRWVPLAVSVAVVVTIYVLLKSPRSLSGEPLLLQVPAVVGLSFVLFRCLHLLVDCRSGDIAIPSVWEYLRYTTYWPCLLSGPIQHYPDFQRQSVAWHGGIDRRIVYRALSLLLSGYFFAVVLGGAIDLWLKVVGPRAADNSASLGLTAMAYFLFLYFNFAGYTRMALGTSLLFGIVLPDNFREPWRARNLLEFWGRWHITLSSWLRTYVFTPLMRRLAEVQPQAGGGVAHAVLATFVTFVLIGLWHGNNVVFLGYGISLATGCCINLLYQRALRARLGKERVQALNGMVAYQLLCGMLTLSFMAVCLVSFWRDGTSIVAILNRHGLVIIPATMIAAAGAALPIVAGALVLESDMRAIAWVRRIWAYPATTVARRVVYAALSLVWALNSAQENLTFVYQQF